MTKETHITNHQTPMTKRMFGIWDLGFGIFTDGGFTLVEVMIAMAIFTVIITIGMESVLSAMQQHRSSQNMRTVMDSLNFAMEDIARNIRLGTNIRCESLGDSDAFDSTTLAVLPENCPSGSNKIFFNDFQGNHLAYIITLGAPLGTGIGHQIVKQQGDDPAIAQIISPPGVVIDTLRSGFTVRGALTSPDDSGQPTVIIRLAGKITSQGVDSKFAIETAVVLRSLDN